MRVEEAVRTSREQHGHTLAALDALNAYVSRELGAGRLPDPRAPAERGVTLQRAFLEALDTELKAVSLWDRALDRYEEARDQAEEPLWRLVEALPHLIPDPD